MHGLAYWRQQMCSQQSDIPAEPPAELQENNKIRFNGHNAMQTAFVCCCCDILFLECRILPSVSFPKVSRKPWLQPRLTFTQVTHTEPWLTFPQVILTKPRWVVLCLGCMHGLDCMHGMAYACQQMSSQQNFDPAKPPAKLHEHNTSSLHKHEAMHLLLFATSYACIAVYSPSPKSPESPSYSPSPTSPTQSPGSPSPKSPSPSPGGLFCALVACMALTA